MQTYSIKTGVYKRANLYRSVILLLKRCKLLKNFKKFQAPDVEIFAVGLVAWGFEKINTAGKCTKLQLNACR